MEFLIDPDVRRVLEFMQENIPAVKLYGVSEALPQMGRLLWGQHPQEPVVAATLLTPKGHLSQSDSSESVLAQ